MFMDYTILSIGSMASLVMAVMAALLRTQTVVDWLDAKLLNGNPRKLTQASIDTINQFFKKDEVSIKAILKQHPKLTFSPYTYCDSVVGDIAALQQRRDEFEANQRRKGLPNDPHAFVYPRSEVGFSSDGTNSSLKLYAARTYSDLATLPNSTKEKLLVLGASNLLIDPYAKQLIAHVRGEASNSQAGKLHGFGGGYMSYWESGNKTTSVRRDDQKSLRITAMRELNEEAGTLSLNHVPNLVYVAEETHIENEPGKLGHLTFFYVTRMEKDELLTSVHSGDAREGYKHPIDLTWGNVRSMITRGTISNLNVHPQFRAVLAAWILQGAPGIHFLRRWRLSNFFTRRNLLALLKN